MLPFKKNILEKVKSTPKRLVLPEGADNRVLKAAELIIKERFTTELYVLGDPDDMNARAKAEGIDLSGVNLVHHVKSPKLTEYAAKYFEMRKHKGVSEEESVGTMKDDVFHGAMMLHNNDVDAMVSGSLTPTAKTVRAAITIVGPREGIKTVSGSFVMVTPSPYGHDGAFVYADSGVVPEPTSYQLVDIAIASADTTRRLLGCEPVVAFLSFSTKGSAKSPSVLKVVEAVEIIKGTKPDFIFDGEMQFDAAIVPEICDMKAPGSPVKGRANTMIFPDLNAGNICYKATQRLTGGEAYGPLIQGLSKPLNDLSRGCTPEDIMIVSAITVAQSI